MVIRDFGEVLKVNNGTISMPVNLILMTPYYEFNLQEIPKCLIWNYANSESRVKVMNIQ